MSLRTELKNILQNSELTEDEVRAFGTGLLMLTEKEQAEFASILKQDPELIYPLYINFKAKLRAVHGTNQDWIEAVETEVVQLEDYITKKRVGGEIR